jgi:TetR/AcrR family transcriptional repressor of nem operon
MRYVKGHGPQTRSRIVENASYGLRQNGADGVSVSRFDEASLVSRGGYLHFTRFARSSGYRGVRPGNGSNGR